MIPVEDAEALHAEVKALRAEVREVVAILENLTADRNHAGGEGANPSGGIRPDDGPAGGAGADETWSRLSTD